MTASILAIAVALVTGSDPVPTVGKWGVNYGATQCLVTRTFGTKPMQYALAIDAAPISGKGDVSLLLPPSMKSGTVGSAVITALPSGTKTKASWYDLKGGPDLAAIRLVFADKTTWDQIDAATLLSISGVGTKPILVPVDGFAKATAAAKTCGQKLMKDWGADPNALVEESQRHDPAAWFYVSDYPLDALRAEQQGIVKTMVAVSATGKPTECRVVVTSGSPSLDKATCKALMARARYDPSDLPVRYDFNRTVWQIPS